MQAHRVAYLLSSGDIPPGINILHRCDNPPCCNPSHLFAGTQKENIGDCVTKGRLRPRRVIGAGHHKAKISDNDVLEIRNSTLSSGVLAAKYGIGREQIWMIRTKKAWRHLP
jgi:hypothetical protein